MKTYIALVRQEGDSAFGVEFPDLPGCFSAADRLEDVVPRAAEALDLWFEDQPAVEPRAVDAIRAGAADALAEGAFLIGVPFVRRLKRQVRVNVSLDAGELEAIDARAAALGLTRSAYLAQAALQDIRGAA